MDENAVLRRNGYVVSRNLSSRLVLLEILKPLGRETRKYYTSQNVLNGKSKLALPPTVKPVALVADAIRDCSNRGGIILDPFGGAGTTLIAAEKTGRRARLIEIDPGYVDIAILRWQCLTRH